MAEFNQGKPYHGKTVDQGRLKGATDTDYFYFFCPRCDGKEIVRILEYGIHGEGLSVNPYDNRTKSKAKGGFTLAFKFHCEKCGLTDFFKISNTGWQRGKYEELPTLPHKLSHAQEG